MFVVVPEQFHPDLALDALIGECILRQFPNEADEGRDRGLEGGL